MKYLRMFSGLYIYRYTGIVCLHSAVKSFLLKGYASEHNPLKAGLEEISAGHVDQLEQLTILDNYLCSIISYLLKVLNQF